MFDRIRFKFGKSTANLGQSNLLLVSDIFSMGFSISNFLRSKRKKRDLRRTNEVVKSKTWGTQCSVYQLHVRQAVFGRSN